MGGVGLMMFVGGAFSTGLGYVLVDWEREDSLAKAGRYAVWTSAGAAVVGLIMIISAVVMSCTNPTPLKRYTIDAHYMNGEVRRITMDGYKEPTIRSVRGSYWVATDLCTESAVIIFDLVRVDTLKEERR